ncbi:ATP-binding protein [Accumulibacter sp.]|uniref:sensor histidine kinase n=1 Tax=Accumulibacter sp. TaxID=2053492 RepID=UPI00263288BF|nr:ATP-binding protein [Accumulibacter sp.]
MTDAPMALVCAHVRATGITASYARRPATSPGRFVHARIAAFLLATFLAVLAPPLLADAPSRNVLVIYANGRLLPANFEADGGLRETIRTSSGRPVSIFDEFLDAPNFGGDAYAEIIANYLREKYASRPPDVVVAAGAEALSFLLHHRSTLFPGVPLVHLAIPVALLRSMQLPRDVVGVPVEYDFSLTVEQALRWHPQARRLVLITGASAWDREWEARLRREATRFSGRVTVEFLAGLPTDAVQRRLQELAGDAVVFTPGYFVDGDGHHGTPRQSVETIAAAAAVPVYGPFSSFIGSGVVGGYLHTFNDMGRQAGAIVKALLAGSAPASLRLPALMPNSLQVDWRQLRRWGINADAVPDDAVIDFRQPSLLERYRAETIAAIVALLLQAGLIASLLFERRRRRRAEAAVHLQRHELAHASRLAIAGELTGAIAHEINQPLAAILSNADAADLMLESGGDRSNELRQILTDIRRDDLRASAIIQRLRALLSRHQVERQAFELNAVLDDVASLLRGEARRRQLRIAFKHATKPVMVAGDRIQIEQVLINLILNAMDAVVGIADDRRTTVVVAVEQIADGMVAISVRDRGPGIAVEHLPKIFDSFFSTKRDGMGLGLSIARTIVDAHAGRIVAENAAGGGALLQVELPTARLQLLTAAPA